MAKYIITEVTENTKRYLVDATDEADALKQWDGDVVEKVEQTKFMKKAELHSSLVKANAVVEPAS